MTPEKAKAPIFEPRGFQGVRLYENLTVNHDLSIYAQAGERQEFDLALCDFSKKDARWDKHRSNTQDVQTSYSLEEKYTRLSERMGLCSNLLCFSELCDKETGEIGLKLKQAMFCNVRHCPVCCWRRSLRNVARFYERIPEVMEAHPKSAWLFVTLTIKNPEMCDLRSTLSDMNKGFKRMIERKSFPAIGYIRTTEITRGQDGNPHPHFHCLLLVKPSYFKGGVYLTQLDWAMLWQACLRIDYLPVVDVRRVKADSEKAKAAEEIEGKIAGLKAAVLETLKYSVKVEDMLTDSKFLYGITDQLRGLRFLATGGVLKDFLQDEVSEDEMINTGNDEEQLDVPDDSQPVLFNWRSNERKYRKVRA